MIFQPHIEDYLMQVTPEREAIVREMEAYAATEGFPIVGPLVGRLLFQMARAIGANKVLELGSGFGYSAWWLARAIGDRGYITMTDNSEDNRRLALDYLKRGGIRTGIDYRVGDALRILSQLDTEYDFILNDIDKDRYPDTIDPVAERLRPGGLFVTDNLLWSGRVCEEPKDEATLGVVEFTRRLYSDPRFFTTILPLRDGLAMAIRL